MISGMSLHVGGDALPRSVMSLSEPDWRRLAAELILYFHKTPSQVSRICGCSIPAVQQHVAAYVRQRSLESMTSSEDSAFVPVVLEEASPPNDLPDEAPAPSPSIPVEIITPGGLTLRLPLATLDDIAHLLHSIEGKPC